MEKDVLRRVERFGKWMYEFKLMDEVTTPLISKEFQEVHEIRKKNDIPRIDSTIKSWKSLSLYPNTAACNEGFYSFELS